MAMIDDLMRSASLHQNCTLFCSTNQRGRVNQYGLHDPIARELNIKADLIKLFQHPVPCSRATINVYVED